MSHHKPTALVTGSTSASQHTAASIPNRLPPTSVAGRSHPTPQNSTPSPTKAKALTSVSPHTTPAPSTGGDLPPLELPVFAVKDQTVTSVVPMAICSHPCSVESIAVSKDVRWVLTGGGDGHVRQFDFYATMNGKIMLTQAQRQGLCETINRGGVLISQFDTNTEETPSPVYSLAIHSEGVWAVTGGKDSIRLWTIRVEPGICRHTFRGHTGSISNLQLLNGETSLVSSSWDRNLIVWDLNDGKQKQVLRGHTGQITDMRGHPQDPSFLLSTGVDGSVSLWDVRQNRRARELRVDGERVPPTLWGLSVAWDEAGHRAFVGRRNGSVEQWDIGTARTIGILGNHQITEPATALCGMPNGRHVVCGHRDNVRVWDASRGSSVKAPSLVLCGHSGGVISSIYIDPSMRFMVTSSGARGWMYGLSDHHCVFYSITSPIRSK